MPDQAEKEVELTPVEARQGGRSRLNLRVLVLSFVAAVVVLTIIYFFFFRSLPPAPPGG
jgi:hypothetical protein